MDLNKNVTETIPYNLKGGDIMSLIGDRKDLVRKYYKLAKVTYLGSESEYMYRLEIIIPGNPVSDGRPRRNNELNKFYNEKKEFLKGIFREIYKLDPILRRTCIITPHKLVIKTYSLPTKSELKFMSDKEIKEESILSIGKQDNDNIEKVNWDVLQDSEFMIILNDSYTVNNETIKYYSHQPRTHILIDFNEEFTNKLYEHKITSSIEYRMYLCSKKYVIDINHMTDEEAVKYLTAKLLDINSKAHKKINYILKDYSVNIIDELFRMLFFKGNKTDRISIYIKKLKKAEKLSFIVKILTQSSKECKTLFETINKNAEELI